MVTTAQSLPFFPSQRPDLLGNQNKLNTGLRAGWRIFDFLRLLTSIFWLSQNRGDGWERIFWVANIKRFKQAKFFARFTERRTLVYKWSIGNILVLALAPLGNLRRQSSGLAKKYQNWPLFGRKSETLGDFGHPYPFIFKSGLISSEFTTFLCLTQSEFWIWEYQQSFQIIRSWLLIPERIKFYNFSGYTFLEILKVENIDV